MKRTNNFAVEGFVANAEVRQFNTASKAQFTIGITRREKKGEEFVDTKAYIQCEAWRKNENCAEFELLTKGTEVLVEGFFEPQSWEAEDGKRVRLVFAVTHITKVQKEHKQAQPTEAAQPEANEVAKPKASRKKSEKKEA